MNSILNSILNHRPPVAQIVDTPTQSTHSTQSNKKTSMRAENNFNDLDDLKSKIDELISDKASVKEVHEFFMKYINILENMDDNESF